MRGRGGREKRGVGRWVGGDVFGLTELGLAVHSVAFLRGRGVDA